MGKQHTHTANTPTLIAYRKGNMRKSLPTPQASSK
jgi:hypothetical protein